MKKLRAGLVGALLVLASLLPVTPAQADAPAGTNLQLMSWNICGAKLKWGCENFGTWANKLSVIQGQITDNYVQAMLLQEICENELTSLMTTLGSGWTRHFAPYQWSQEGVLSNSRCGGATSDRQDTIGTAIVIKAGSSNHQIVKTSQPWIGQQRPVHCATATYFNNIRLCNAHLALRGSDTRNEEWEYADDQLGALKKVVDGYSSVAFGGDFNIRPPDHVYPVNDPEDPDRGWVWEGTPELPGNPYPQYRECDQTSSAGGGRATHRSVGKIDYAFSSRPWRWCAVTPTTFSDHYPIVYSMQIS